MQSIVGIELHLVRIRDGDVWTPQHIPVDSSAGVEARMERGVALALTALPAYSYSTKAIHGAFRLMGPTCERGSRAATVYQLWRVFV